jgi:hypothetical protein
VIVISLAFIIFKATEGFWLGGELAKCFVSFVSNPWQKQSVRDSSPVSSWHDKACPSTTSGFQFLSSQSRLFFPWFVTN